MDRLARLTAAGIALSIALGGSAMAQPKAEDAAKPQATIEKLDNSAAARRCPPGLAKQALPCLPPGMAPREDGIGVGSPLAGLDYVKVLSWEYGLEPAPPGTSYVVYKGLLLQVDSTTFEVLTLIRAVDDSVN